MGSDAVYVDESIAFDRFVSERLLQGALMVQECRACTGTWHPPSGRCPLCGSANWEWREASVQGELYSFTIVHHAPSASFKEHVPYIIGWVELEGSARVLGFIVGVSDAIRVGQRVWLATPDETFPYVVPTFYLSREEAGTK